MRPLLLSLLLACAACTRPAGEAQPVPSLLAASTAAPDASSDDEPIEVFFARFQAAVRDRDLDALTALARFPLVGAEVDRGAFVRDLYPSYLEAGPFRDVLLAAEPGDLEPMDDGSYRYQALVTYNEEGEAVKDGEYESAILFTFRPDGEGGWYLAEVWFAG
jgi:hypothetical protein